MKNFKINACLFVWAFSSLFVSFDVNAQCIVTTGNDTTIYCQGSVSLKADVPLWQKKSTGASSDLKTAVAFGDTILALGTNVGVRSTDKGATWNNLVIPTNAFYGIKMIKPNTIIAISRSSSSSGRVYQTTDAGLNWSMQDEKSSYFYWDVNSYKDSVLWIVGEKNWYGKILKSNGNTSAWSEVNLPISQFTKFYAVSAPTKNKCIAGGGDFANGFFFITNNGGISWDSVKFNTLGGSFGVIRDIFFIDSLTGFASGDNETILKTIDGGLSWATKNTNFSGISLNSIYFQNSFVGYASGNDGLVYKTTDGGNTWFSFNIPDTYSLSTVTGFGPGDVYMFSGMYNGSCWVYKPKNYSFYWSNGSLLNSEFLQNPTATVNQSTKFVVTAMDETGCVAKDSLMINVIPMTVKAYNNQTILEGSGSVNLYAKAEFQGNATITYTWANNPTLSATNIQNPVATPASNTTYKVTAHAGNNCLASDSVTITVTPYLVNAGNDLSIQYGGNVSILTNAKDFNIYETANINPTGCNFISTSTGYIWGDNQVLKTTDGGKGWIPILDTAGLISCANFKNSMGIVANLAGDVYITHNTGNSWIRVSATSYQPRDIQIINLNTIYLATSNSLIKTTNGGLSWNTTNLNPGNDVTDIYFLNENVGYAAIYALSGAIIKKTTDGGNTWTILNINSSSYVHEIIFLNETKGFIADFNTLKVTTDGGNTWSNANIVQGIPNYVAFQAISFANDSVGFAGTPLMKTTDGGMSWNLLDADQLLNHLWDLSAVDNNHVFGAKTNGGLYNYLNPSFSWNPSSFLYNSTAKCPIFTPGVTTQYAVTATTNNGAIAHDTVTVTVPDPCTADFTYNVVSGTNTVNFETPVGLPPYVTNTFYYQWVFSDGAQSTLRNPSHTFTSPGFHGANLTVWSNNGCNATSTQNIEIGNASTIDCLAAFDFAVDNVTKNVTFINLSQGQNLSHYFWYFDDSQYSFTQNTSHIYQQAGIYNVCLTVFSQSQNCYNTFCKQIAVDTNGTHCMAKFTYATDSTTLTTNFFNQSMHNPNNYLWEFGDNQTSIDEEPQHAYSTAGHYFTHLQITEGSCISHYAALVNVAAGNSSLLAAFGYVLNNTFTKSTEYPVTFYAATNGTPAKYFWNFGDGSVDSLTNRPIHNYTQAGNFQVCLTISDPVINSSYQVCKMINIQGSSIKDQSSNRLNIYPNPVQNIVFFRFNKQFLTDAEISIYSIDGKLIYHQLIEKNLIQNDSYPVDLSFLQNGVYSITLKSGNENISQKLIINK